MLSSKAIAGWVGGRARETSRMLRANHGGGRWSRSSSVSASSQSSSWVPRGATYKSWVLTSPDQAIMVRAPTTDARTKRKRGSEGASCRSAPKPTSSDKFKSAHSAISAPDEWRQPTPSIASGRTSHTNPAHLVVPGRRIEISYRLHPSHPTLPSHHHSKGRLWVVIL